MPDEYFWGIINWAKAVYSWEDGFYQYTSDSKDDHGQSLPAMYLQTQGLNIAHFIAEWKKKTKKKTAESKIRADEIKNTSKKF